MIVISLIKAIVFYFIFMVAGANLLGFIVRQIFKSGLSDDLRELKVVIRHDLKLIDIFISIFFSIITMGCLYVLFHYFNIGVLIAATIIMFTRLPDLLFEIKIGQKVNSRIMPRKRLDFIISLLSWAAFPLLWYSLYILQNPKGIF